MTYENVASRRVARVLAAGFLTAVAGCSADLPTDVLSYSSPAGDSITLASITPAAGTRLRKGEEVTFTASLNYTLASAPSGHVSMVIQNEFGRSLQAVGQPVELIARGTGTVTLADSIVIPRSGSSFVTVFFPLGQAGRGSTNVVASVSYPVN